MLRKMERDAATKYVSNELQKEGGALYEIPNASTEQVNEHFQGMLDNSTQSSAKYSQDGKVIDTYSIPNSSCVTKTIEGVNAGGGTIPNVTTFVPNVGLGATISTPPITPAQVKTALSGTTQPLKKLPVPETKKKVE